MTIEIQLTKGYVAIVDDEDADLAEQKWVSSSGRSDASIYAVRLGRRMYGEDTSQLMLLHRLILERTIGRKLSCREYVDHIDRNCRNNTRRNLRIATPSENSKNRRKSKTNTSGYKGVFAAPHSTRNPWFAKIQVNGKQHYLGCFKTPQEAYEAYCKAARVLHGEFASI